MGNIVWLASYPKSGNTWLRAFLANLVADRDGRVVDHDPDLPLGGHLVEHAGDAAAGGVLHRDDVLAARPERLADEAVQRGDVGPEVALEPQVVAARHDGHAVVAHVAGHDEPVARPEPGVGDHALGERDPRRVHDDAVEKRDVAGRGGLRQSARQRP